MCPSPKRLEIRADANESAVGGASLLYKVSARSTANRSHLVESKRFGARSALVDLARS